MRMGGNGGETTLSFGESPAPEAGTPPLPTSTHVFPGIQHPAGELSRHLLFLPFCLFLSIFLDFRVLSSWVLVFRFLSSFPPFSFNSLHFPRAYIHFLGAYIHYRGAYTPFLRIYPHFVRIYPHFERIHRTPSLLRSPFLFFSYLLSAYTLIFPSYIQFFRADIPLSVSVYAYIRPLPCIHPSFQYVNSLLPFRSIPPRTPLWIYARVYSPSHILSCHLLCSRFPCPLPYVSRMFSSLL
jgi:hypothetical protein